MWLYQQKLLCEILCYFCLSLSGLLPSPLLHTLTLSGWEKRSREECGLGLEEEFPSQLHKKKKTSGVRAHKLKMSSSLYPPKAWEKSLYLPLYNYMITQLWCFCDMVSLAIQPFWVCNVKGYRLKLCLNCVLTVVLYCELNRANIYFKSM